MELYIFRDNQQSGPFPVSAVRAMIQEGALQLTDLGWCEGLTEWTPIREVLRLPNTPQLGYPASLIQRLCAAIIDLAIVVVAIFVGWGLFIGHLGKATDADLDRTLGEALEPHWIFFWSIPVVIIWLYFAGTESFRTQGSVGKGVVGLKVTDLNGNRITFGRATWRVAGRLLSALTLGIGFLICAWTRKRQCLHDVFSGCLVMRRK